MSGESCRLGFVMPQQRSPGLCMTSSDRSWIGACQHGGSSAPRQAGAPSVATEQAHRQAQQ
eukprot:72010-Chlamydomonas_euryale.AAC.1